LPLDGADSTVSCPFTTLKVPKSVPFPPKPAYEDGKAVKFRLGPDAVLGAVKLNPAVAAFCSGVDV